MENVGFLELLCLQSSRSSFLGVVVSCLLPTNQFNNQDLRLKLAFGNCFLTPHPRFPNLLLIFFRSSVFDDVRCNFTGKEALPTPSPENAIMRLAASPNQPSPIHMHPARLILLFFLGEPNGSCRPLNSLTIVASAKPSLNCG